MDEIHENLSVCEDTGRNSFRRQITSVCQSRLFTVFIGIIIVLDQVLLCHLIAPTSKKVPAFLQIADMFFLLVYLMEFVMKVYIDPRGYWNRPLNIIVFIVVLASCICVYVGIRMQDASILRFCLITRLFPEPFLQEHGAAYWRATKIAIHMFGIVFVVTMMYAVVAHDLFAAADPDNWGDLSTILLNQFSLAAMDNLADLQQRLYDSGMNSSWIFTTSFMILVHVLLKSIITVYRVFRNNIDSRLENSSEKSGTKIIKSKARVKEELCQEQKDEKEDINELLERIEKTLTRRNIKVESVCCSQSVIKNNLYALHLNIDTSIKLLELYEEMLHVMGQQLEMKINEERLAEGFCENVPQKI